MGSTMLRIDPTNAVIVSKDDGKIIRNGIRMRCPGCGISLMHNYGTVPIWNVGAVGRWECCKCRKQYHTITLPVPMDTTPEEFYEKIRGALVGKEAT